MLTKLEWLNGPPTEEGYYWFQLWHPKNNVPISSTLRFTYVGWECLCKRHTEQCRLVVTQAQAQQWVDIMRRRWAGPIPQPDMFAGINQEYAQVKITRLHNGC